MSYEMLKRATTEEDIARSVAEGAGGILGVEWLRRAPTALAKKIISSDKLKDDALFKKLVDYGESLGVHRMDTSKMDAGELAFRRAAGPHYDPMVGKVFAPDDHPLTSPSVFAHELGHSQSMGKAIKNRNYLLAGIQGLSRIGSQRLAPNVTKLTAMGNGFLGDDALFNLGLAGSVASTPMLAEELSASARGANMIRRLGGNKLKALGAFGGIPSYLGYSVMPMLPWLARKADRAISS